MNPVQMFTCWRAQRLNVLPMGDLGVRAAMKKAYGLAELPKPQEMERIAAVLFAAASRGWYLQRRSVKNQGAMLATGAIRWQKVLTMSNTR